MEDGISGLANNWRVFCHGDAIEVFSDVVRIAGLLSATRRAVHEEQSRRSGEGYVDV